MNLSIDFCDELESIDKTRRENMLQENKTPKTPPLKKKAAAKKAEVSEKFTPEEKLQLELADIVKKLIFVENELKNIKVVTKSSTRKIKSIQDPKKKEMNALLKWIGKKEEAVKQYKRSIKKAFTAKDADELARITKEMAYLDGQIKKLDEEIKLGSETSALSDELKKVDSALGKVQKELSSISTSEKGAKVNTEDDLVRKELSGVLRWIDKKQAAIKEYKQELKKQQSALDQAQQMQLAALKEELDSINDKLSSLTNEKTLLTVENINEFDRELKRILSNSEKLNEAKATASRDEIVPIKSEIISPIPPISKQVNAINEINSINKKEVLEDSLVNKQPGAKVVTKESYLANKQPTAEPLRLTRGLEDLSIQEIMFIKEELKSIKAKLNSLDAQKLEELKASTKSSVIKNELMEKDPDDIEHTKDKKLRTDGPVVIKKVHGSVAKNELVQQDDFDDDFNQLVEHKKAKDDNSIVVKKVKEAPTPAKKKQQDEDAKLELEFSPKLKNDKFEIVSFEKDDQPKSVWDLILRFRKHKPVKEPEKYHGPAKVVQPSKKVEPTKNVQKAIIVDSQKVEIDQKQLNELAQKYNVEAQILKKAFEILPNDLRKIANQQLPRMINLLLEKGYISKKEEKVQQVEMVAIKN